MPATVNRWPASEAGHRGARCGKRVYRGGPPYLPAAVNRYLPRRATLQNCGVRYEGEEESTGQRRQYYGQVEEIWELDYGQNLRITVFRC